MKGLTASASGRKPGSYSPQRVMSASNLRGQGATTRSSKSSMAGGFTASRKKGSVRGSLK